MKTQLKPPEFQEDLIDFRKKGVWMQQMDVYKAAEGNKKAWVIVGALMVAAIGILIWKS